MMNELYDLLNDFGCQFYNSGYQTFPLNVSENENGYLVEAEIPGFSKDEIKASFDNNVLTISAEHKNKEDRNTKYLLKERLCHKYSRSINFGDINLDNMTAKYENGILTINVLTKKKEEPEVKSITIE